MHQLNIRLINIILVVFIGLVCLNERALAEPQSNLINQKTGQLAAPEKPAFGEDDMEQAKALFMDRCVRCHGRHGDGRGQLASHLSPRPTDLTNPYWFRETNQKKLKRVIIGGGGAIGKSVLMPANPDLRNKPKVLAALIQYIVALAPRTTE